MTYSNIESRPLRVGSRTRPVESTKCRPLPQAITYRPASLDYASRRKSGSTIDTVNLEKLL